MAEAGADLARAALLVVDMQNDFLHPDGSFGRLAKEKPIDFPFLTATVPYVRQLIDAFRAVGRPVVYIAHVLKPDYSDAAFPYWRLGLDPSTGNRTHCVEGTWGAQIIEELKPADGETIVEKKGFGGFANTPLDTILRNQGVTTCVAAGVTTCVCVSNTVRGGVEYNYRMILARDAVAEVSRASHESEVATMQRVFADVLTTDEIIARLKKASDAC